MTARILDCEVDDDCTCIEDTKCKFGQAYGEGSSYHGFWVEDFMYFGSPPNKESRFRYEFACVTNETNLFYTQEADGILGLAGTGRKRIKPLFEEMKKQGVIDNVSFSLCLGYNGGHFSIGGFKSDLIATPEEDLIWVPLIPPNNHYTIELTKVTVGDIEIPRPPKRAFIDSGTTFSFMSIN